MSDKVTFETVELSFHKVTGAEQTASAVFMREHGWKITRDGDTVTLEHVGNIDEKGRGVKSSGEVFTVPWGACHYGEIAPAKVVK